MQTIEPTVTNEEESEALGIPLHSPAFLFERVTRSERGEIVEFVHSIYRGDRYRLVTDLSAQPLPHRPALTAVAGQDQRDGRGGAPLSRSCAIGLDISARSCANVRAVAKWYKPIVRPFAALQATGGSAATAGRRPSQWETRR